MGALTYAHAGASHPVAFGTPIYQAEDTGTGMGTHSSKISSVRNVIMAGLP